MGDELARGVLRIVAFNPRQDLAERGGKLYQGLVLLRREIILNQLLALDRANDRFRPRRMPHEPLGEDAPVPILRRNDYADLAVRLFGIPFAEGVLAIDWVGAHVGDLDAH